MQGNTSVTFYELFVDTIRVHGLAWAYAYYTKRGMEFKEFHFWLTSVRLNKAPA